MTTTNTKTTEALRNSYRQIRSLRTAEARYGFSFDKAVQAYITTNGLPATPESFVSVARIVRVECQRCVGTGRFITYVLNGVPRGPGGECYRCQGKGHQTEADAHRNRTHDEHYVPAGC